MSQGNAALLAVSAGALIAVQATLLGLFARHVHPLAGALWVHVGGLVFAVVAVGFASSVSGLGFGLSGVARHPWGMLAGVAGVGIVAMIGAAVTPLGLGTTLVVVTATQLVLSLVLDAFGIMGRVVPITPARALGVLFLIAGAVLTFARSP